MIKRIKSLCNANKTNFSRLEKELGFGNGTIAKMSPETTAASRVKAIADYFGVGMEYLITGVMDAPAAESYITKEDRYLLELFHRVGDDTRRSVMILLENAPLAEDQKKKEA